MLLNPGVTKKREMYSTLQRYSVQVNIPIATTLDAEFGGLLAPSALI